MALAKIVYASMTGNTEEIADIVAKKLEELGHTVDVDECTTVDAADFEDADICIVATYTYGDGELPDESLTFTKIWLTSTCQVNLWCCRFRRYFYDYFCHSVDEFENQFTFTGATKGADSVKVDLSAEDEDIENLEAFAEKVSEALA